MQARLITADLVAAAFASGSRRIVAPRGEAIVTPAAWSKAVELGVAIVQSVGDVKSAGDAEATANAKVSPTPALPPEDKGSSERIVDPSGLLVVRGHSVRLGKFTGAGPERNIGLTDLVSGGDGSPMTAGIMSWTRADSFPWTLDYDEVDLVLDGILQITIDGRTLEGRAGDVFYIPKGSNILFGTPSSTRVFYVTYPADWATARPESRRVQR